MTDLLNNLFETLNKMWSKYISRRTLSMVTCFVYLVLLEKDESASDCFCLVNKTQNGMSRTVQLGKLQIEWKR